MKRSPLFRGISQEELPGLLSCLDARTRIFKKGELLLHRGERTEYLGLLQSGTVHIIREDFWGNRSIVGLAGPGDTFAESYALSREPMEVSVLESAGRWFGMTYQADRAAVSEELKKLHADGVYPPNLQVQT